MMVLPMKTYSTGKQVVDWSKIVSGDTFTIGQSVIEIITNTIVIKVAKKSKKERRERRLTLRLKGFSDTYECGTESFKKGTFFKPLNKLSVHKIVEYITETVNYLPAIWKPVEKKFLGETVEECEEIMFDELEACDSITDINRWYKKYIKYYHPDFLGRDLFPYEEIMFECITHGRDEGRELFRQFEEVTNEYFM